MPADNKSKILLTCRDIGAAHHIREIAGSFSREKFNIVIVASRPGYELFSSTGLNTIEFCLPTKGSYISPSYTKRELKLLLDKAEAIIISEKPDAIICGLSSYGIGIDEATLYLANTNRMNIPSFQFIDSWGTFNHLDDGYPSIYLGIDEDVLNYAQIGAKAPIKIVGSPKHCSYALKPIFQWRETVRQRLKVGDKDKLIGYFGQDPYDVGQEYNFKLFINAVINYNSKHKRCKLAIHKHPAYRNKYGYFLDYLKNIAVDIVDTSEVYTTEELLSACDLIASCLSTVAVDHAYLTSLMNRPIGVALHLLCGDAIKEYFSKNFGYWKLPIVEKGIGYVAEHESSMESLMEYLLNNPLASINYFQSAKSLLCDDANKKILNIILSFLIRKND